MLCRRVKFSLFSPKFHSKCNSHLNVQQLSTLQNAACWLLSVRKNPSPTSNTHSLVVRQSRELRKNNFLCSAIFVYYEKVFFVFVIICWLCDVVVVRARDSKWKWKWNNRAINCECLTVIPAHLHPSLYISSHALNEDFSSISFSFLAFPLTLVCSDAARWDVSLDINIVRIFFFSSFIFKYPELSRVAEGCWEWMDEEWEWIERNETIQSGRRMP